MKFRDSSFQKLNSRFCFSKLFPMSLLRLPRTPESRKLASLRISIALIFLAIGLSKLLVPIMVVTFQEQLKATGVPVDFRGSLSLLFPILEIVIGYFLLIGKYTRFWSAIAMGVSCYGIYIHLHIDDPSLFPFQPTAPVIPITLMALSAVLFVMGAGMWSKDLDIFEK